MSASFAKAILENSLSVPSDIIGSTHRFDVYRNNYVVSLTETLTTVFPTVCRLVGQEYFDALAGAYISEHHPTSPIMAFYGDTFADFIESFPPLSTLPYLADIARIEWARSQTPNIAPHITYQVVGREELEAALKMPVKLAPGTVIIKSAFPAHTIWQHNQAEQVAAIPNWEPETVVIWNKDHEPHQQLLTGEMADTLKSATDANNFLEGLADITDEQKITDMVNAFASFLNQGILIPGDPDYGE